MIRDIRLQGLSAEHHHALVLARKLSREATGGTSGHSAVAELSRQFDKQLQPHFAIEEQVLLPALLARGEDELVHLTASDHARLRELVVAAQDSNLSAVAAFAELLERHVRFEERELFPRCEQCLSDEILDEVARRVPAPRGKP